MTQRLAIALSVTLGLFAQSALADLEEKLIKLDREWGEATKPEQLEALLTEDFILLTEDGTSSRKQLMDELTKAPPGEPYVAGGYKINKVNDKVVIMVHTSGTGDKAHSSMHVWRVRNGNWKVAASAAVAADD